MTAQAKNRIYPELAQTWWDENELLHLLSEESCTANAESPEMEGRHGVHAVQKNNEV
jgi:hypothetical protein